MFEIKAREPNEVSSLTHFKSELLNTFKNNLRCEKHFKPQNTKVFEDLKCEQQRRYRTLWTDTI